MRWECGKREAFSNRTQSASFPPPVVAANSAGVRSANEEVRPTVVVVWRGTIKLADDIKQILDKGLQNREVMVIIADERSVSGGAWKTRLAAVDAHAGENCILFIGLQTVGTFAVSPSDAQAKLALLAPRLSAASRVGWFPWDAPELLKTRLEERVVMLRMSLVKSDPAKPLVDETLVRYALDNQGLRVTSRPYVNGPAGAKP